MRSKAVRWLLVATISIVNVISPHVAQAASYACSGVVTGVALSPSGVVTVYSADAGLNAAYICQIGSTYNGVGPDACKAILAVLVSAKATGIHAEWSFNDGLSCTTHPAWDVLTGWYYGPVLR
ncbi:MAG TPA: hypothetical protein VIF82_16740 [Burkholderiaceae bacterium]|jgi:hypothetical protein